MKPYFETDRGELYNGDCMEVMRQLPSKSVNCGITSPPYFGLRNYGIDGQLGLEPTPEAYISNLVSVFQEFKRVLRDDGTLWLNLGDSYTGGGKVVSNLKPKNLVGIPWRVAFALQTDGWYLRQDIIWHKPNPMPESITDRCTKAHEYIFLLSKSPKYYYDYEVIKKPCVVPLRTRKRLNGKRNDELSKGQDTCCGVISEFRNKRSVWTVTTNNFKEAHFATFPPDLILPCVLAGCPKDGVIMDMFFGAGTTGLVAIENKRKFIGVELSEKYCEIAAKRIESAASQKRF